jgi:GNAT superfamily N-acetyltransferase
VLVALDNVSVWKVLGVSIGAAGTSAEHFFFVDPAVQGCGVGQAVLAAPIASNEQTGIWTIWGGIHASTYARPTSTGSRPAPLIEPRLRGFT